MRNVSRNMEFQRTDEKCKLRHRVSKKNAKKKIARNLKIKQ